MIIVVCKLDYLMYINIKYVNTGDSSLTAERSFFLKPYTGRRLRLFFDLLVSCSPFRLVLKLFLLVLTNYFI